jgi:hypothetical protein
MKIQTAGSGLFNGPGARRLVLALAIALASLPAPGWAAGEFTSDFLLENCTWSAWGRQNPFWNLRPGRQLVLEGEEDGTEIRAEITNLRQLETISFVTAKGVPVTVHARVIEEREFEDGEIVEISRNWFARCVETGNIFYFGEEVDIFEDGELVNHEGAWRAGEDGAQPGVMMPGSFLVGAKYFQEMAPDVAEDRAEHTRMGFSETVPAGTFNDCGEVEETTPLNPGGRDHKVYCPGVGIVRDQDLELVEIRIVP